MLTLDDFFHLDEVDLHLQQLSAELDRALPGLIIVAGLDPRPALAQPLAAGFLPSGRSTLMRILLRQMLESDPSRRGIVIAEDETLLRAFRRYRKQVEVWAVQPPYTYASRIAEAVSRHPDILVLDRLVSESASAALDAALNGLCVIAELDTVFRGANVARHLLDFGVNRDQLAGLDWVITVQRLPTLCSCSSVSCRRSGSPARAYAVLIESDRECVDEQLRLTARTRVLWRRDGLRHFPRGASLPVFVVEPARDGSQCGWRCWVTCRRKMRFNSVSEFHRTYNLLAPASAP
jgi:hypothetical protein